MNYPSFYIKKYNNARFILAITFLFLLIELNAQEKDTININISRDISEVEINGSLNTSKYLWNLLKENYSIERPDTTIFYIIDFKIEVPDSNYFEQFKGIIAVEYKDNKNTVFVCEGTYRDSNIFINDSIKFAPTSINIPSIFVKPEIGRYRKFKRNQEFKHNKAFNEFKTSININEEFANTIYMFDNRLLISLENVSTFGDKWFFSEVLFSYSKLEYSSLYLVKYNLILKYKFRNVNATESIYIESTKNNNYTKKQEINQETPKSLYEYISVMKN